jgi:hypothetical protein
MRAAQPRVESLSVPRSRAAAARFQPTHAAARFKLALADGSWARSHVWRQCNGTESTQVANDLFV